MGPGDFNIDFNAELKKREEIVSSYIMRRKYTEWFNPPHFRDAVYSYLKQGGKRLRPAVLLFASGAVGGNEEDAIPAAAALEVFHTWTLVHDDLIDNDEKRRGGPTVHETARRKALEELGYSPERSREYGRDIAILCGDSQHAWAVSLLVECALEGKIDPQVVLVLIAVLESYVINALVCGETLDIEYAQTPVEKLTEEEIIRMLWLKTGVLYEFAGMAGAMLGLNSPDRDNARVRAVSEFTSLCGTAFQLQDDILGIIGDEKILGKPVGSDIREGKRTIIVYHALRTARPHEKRRLETILGRPDSDAGEIAEARQLLIDLGGVEHTSQLAKQYIEKACPKLDSLEDSVCKRLLLAWADFMIEREF